MGGSVESGLVRQREPGAKTPKVTTKETKKEREKNTRETEKTNRIKRPRKKRKADKKEAVFKMKRRWTFTTDRERKRERERETKTGGEAAELVEVTKRSSPLTLLDESSFAGDPRNAATIVAARPDGILVLLEVKSLRNVLESCQD